MAFLKISESVHMVTDGMLTHPRDCAAYLIQGQAPVLVDCGSGEGHKGLLRNLKRLGVHPRELAGVLATHCHYDHLAGITILRKYNPDLVLAAHDLDAPAIETADPDLTCAGWMFHASLAPERVDETLVGGEMFEIAGLEFEVIHTPGHSPGSVCFRLDRDGKSFVFAGDSLTPSCRRVNGDFDVWEESLHSIADLDCDLFLPGHTSQITNPFYTALMAPAPQGARRAVFRALQKARTPFWNIASLQYQYLISPFARLTDMFVPRG